MIQKIKFKNSRGLLLKGFLCLPANYTPEKHPTAIIFLHGFPSNAEGFSSQRMCRLMRKRPYLFLTFSFSHSPPSDGKFENKLMSREVEDIKCAIDFLERNYPFRKLVLMGHSTGAIDAALYAHKDKRISKLILTGAVHDLKNATRYDFTDIQMHDFWTKGCITYNRPGHWVHRKKLKKAFYDEFFTLDIPKAIKKYKKPLLIIHGEKDEIPLKEPLALFRLANRPKKLAIIRGADHSFHAPKHFGKVVKAIMKFIGEK